MSGVLMLLTTLISITTAPPTTTTTTNPSSTCSLYDDSPVGMVCFHGDEVTNAIATGGTSWLVEFYSSWCGHCQYFAPVWKKLAEDIAGWSSVVQVGVIDCSAKQSYSICTQYKIRAYPTIKFFYPSESPSEKGEDPTSVDYHGERKLLAMEEAIIDHIQSYEGLIPPYWPHLSPIEGDYLLSVPESDWVPVVIVFEEESSYNGRKLILDLLYLQEVQLYRALPSNVILVKHYSIFDFPSLVIEFRKDDYIVVPGHSLVDPRRDFGEAVRKHFHESPHIHSPVMEHNQPPSPHVLKDNNLAALQDMIADTPSRHTRVSPVDVLGAISYILRREVPLHSTVTGSAFTILLRLIHLLESTFTKAYPMAVPSLSLVRAKLETRLSAGFITNRDWLRILDTKLNESVFPRDLKWMNCRGSQSHYRGYPCALWTLSHTLTLLTLPITQHMPTEQTTTSSTPTMTFRSKDALNIMSQFIRIFFSCEHCREHFTEMSRSLDAGHVLYDGDAVLWLWEAHNTVNRRLVRDISSDPLYPKSMFPSPKRCPYCYTYIATESDGRPGQHIMSKQEPNWSNTGFRTNAESLLIRNITAPTNKKNVIYTWNRTAVLLYLLNFYNWNHTHTTTMTHTQVLQAAWPKLFTKPRPPYRYSGQQTELGLNHYDMGLCAIYYSFCITLLVAVGYWLIRRRLRYFNRFLHP